MKDLGESKKIIGIDIIKYRDQFILSISQSTYFEKVIIMRLNLTNAISVALPIAQHFELSAANSPNDTNLNTNNK